MSLSAIRHSILNHKRKGDKKKGKRAGLKEQNVTDRSTFEPDRKLAP